MSRVRVKICGVTSVEDALAAVDAGADALGFNFVPSSPRRIAAETAALIAEALPPFVARVGVFADADRDHVAEVLREAGLHAIQLHGDEPLADCLGWRVPVIKALRVRDAVSLELASHYAGVAALLLDGQSPGSGRAFDWELARGLASRLSAPLVLAGGLTPDNVAAAVRIVRPFAVDVASGVESAPGRKDPAKMRAFVAAVREAA